MGESEKATERYLVEQIKSLGGLCRKYTSPGTRGVPDRLCILPQGIIWFVELKSEGESLTIHQEKEIQRLKDRQQNVTVIDTKHRVNGFIDLLRRQL